MAAVKLLSICLFLILVEKNIGVNAKCTPIQLTVKAEYLESSIRKDYKHTRIITSSSSFRRNFDSLDISASISGSYAGFSAQASASFSEVSESASSSTKSRDETKTTEVTYDPGQNHIIERLTKTVTIDGRAATAITKEIVDVVPEEDSPSRLQLRKRGEEYIAYNYGGIKGGKIRNNVYTASACVEEIYFVKDPNTLCNDKEVIRTLNECTSAIINLRRDGWDIEFEKAESARGFPKGCYKYYGTSGREKAFWNTHNLGAPYELAQPICRRGAGTYSKASFGANCPRGLIVDTVDKCREAATYLGIPYKSRSSGNEKPAGCYYKSQNAGSKIYFNTVTNPNLASPPNGEKRGGVCIKAG